MCWILSPMHKKTPVFLIEKSRGISPGKLVSVLHAIDGSTLPQVLVGDQLNVAEQEKPGKI